MCCSFQAVEAKQIAQQGVLFCFDKIGILADIRSRRRRTGEVCRCKSIDSSLICTMQHSNNTSFASRLNKSDRPPSSELKAKPRPPKPSRKLSTPPVKLSSHSAKSKLPKLSLKACLKIPTSVISLLVEAMGAQEFC